MTEVTRMSYPSWALACLMTATLWFVPQSAFAQCTRDVDCKGERICENGQCVDPQTRTAPGPPSTGHVNIAGVWRHSSGSETLTFTPLGGNRYQVVEEGFAHIRGTATVNGNHV